MTQIDESPFRLPAALATKMYAAEESGTMGYCTFTLVLANGEHLTRATGNAVDFVDLPRRVSADTIINLLPHQQGHPQQQHATATSPASSWCLYRNQR